jgi:hypothetical protein
MKRAGVQDKVAIRISGPKTCSVFDRYNIIDEADIGDAAQKLDEYLQQRQIQRGEALASEVISGAYLGLGLMRSAFAYRNV